MIITMNFDTAMECRIINEACAMAIHDSQHEESVILAQLAEEAERIQDLMEHFHTLIITPYELKQLAEIVMKYFDRIENDNLHYFNVTKALANKLGELL